MKKLQKTFFATVEDATINASFEPFYCSVLLKIMETIKILGFVFKMRVINMPQIITDIRKLRLKTLVKYEIFRALLLSMNQAQSGNNGRTIARVTTIRNTEYHVKQKNNS